MGTTTIYQCDVCTVQSTSGAKNEGGISPRTVPVIFTTEQTEGRSVTPYLTSMTIDMCQGCFERVIEAQPLRGHGAQGNNTYAWAPERRDPVTDPGEYDPVNGKQY